MAGMTSHNDHLKGLWRRAEELAAVCFSLEKLMEEEAVRVQRTDQVARLNALGYSITGQLEKEKSREKAAEDGHINGSLVISAGGLVFGGIIKATSSSKRAQTFADGLLKNIDSKPRPFGTVCVCIGPGGVPGDVSVMSLSRLARNSNRHEAEIVRELQGQGYLLISRKIFLRLIDNLADNVQRGALALPVPAEILSQMISSLSDNSERLT